MTIGEHATTFEGRDVVSYDIEQGAVNPQREAYVLRSDWDDYERFSKQWDALIKDPNRGKVEALIFGMWDEEMFDASTSALVELLVEAADELTSLEAVFFPDVTYEECEISWLNQSDVSPVLEAYPKLKTLRVRGGQYLEFHEVRHEGLKRLIVETGGLGADTVSSICLLNLPNLEHLELWFGSDNYGGDASAEDLAPILSGKLFPKLTSLGLMNSEFANDIARELAGAPVLEQIKTLDMSMGTMTDEGAQHLLSNPALAKLERIDLTDNYISDEMAAKLGDAWSGRTYLDGQREDDGDGWFYASVTE